MSTDVLCLRPEADFTRVDAPAPDTLRVTYRKPDDGDVPALMRASDALIIPAVGPKLAPALFEGSRVKLVQVTGAGLDRLERDAMIKHGIPVANVAGGSNSALAEYAVTTASLLLRRFAWADAELKSGNYAALPRAHGRGQSRRDRRLAGGPRRFRHHRACGRAGVSSHGLPRLLLRSGAARSGGRQGHRRRADGARRAARAVPTWSACMCRCCRRPRG